MAVITFVFVETVVSPELDAEVTPFAVDGAYAAALQRRLTDFWRDMSGGRIEVEWASPIQRQVTQLQAEWSALETRQKIDEVRRQSMIPDGTEIILIANDADAPQAQTPRGSTPYVHIGTLTPATVAHEMGHYFEYRGERRAGHADIAREFFRDEYGDPTCIMGGEGNKLAFVDPAIPAFPLVPRSRRIGPGMNPALVDQSGWLDPASPRVRTVDPNTLGSVILQPWHGAPRADSVQGPPVVALIDGLAADGGRIYVCVREETGWDRRFSALSLPSGAVPVSPGPHLRIFAYLSTPSGDSLLLRWMYALSGSTMVLGRVPLRLTAAHVSPEGVTVQLERSAWRGSALLEGVECDTAAQIATAAWGPRVDAYVIDTGGAVRFNHFNGHGWEFNPWPLLDGITCHPKGGIAAVARHEGRVDIFVTDTSGTVHRRQRTDTQWSPAWEPLTGGGLHAQSSIAATRIDNDTVMLCGVRMDGQVSRAEVGQAGVLSNWTSAPPRAVRHVAAARDDVHRGRIYGVDARNQDRSVWATPDVASPDPRSWGVVGSRSFEPRRPISAGLIVNGKDVVVLGLEPLTALLWSGMEWQEEDLGSVRRQPDGGLSIFSREQQSFEVAYIDTDGRVNVTSWSPRAEFQPAANQYESQSMVLIQAATGHLVQAKNGGGDGMSADSTQAGAWERLRMFECQTVVINAGETRRLVAFQTANGQYVGAVGGGGSGLIAEAATIGPWELFYLHVLPGSFGKVTIRCIDETHFWTAPGGGGGPLAADKSKPQTWETFLLGKVSA